MSFGLRKEIEYLKKNLLALCTMVEENVQKAILACLSLDEKLAQKVVDDDDEIDQREVEMEEECLKILALHQPVAIDLRYLIAALKINNDLERIGDSAVNIAERVLYMVRKPMVRLPSDLMAMTETVRSMLRKCIDAFVSMDVQLAYEVWYMDDLVDETHRNNYQIVQKRVGQCPDDIDVLINFLSISRNLERIADLTTNIVEDVIYLLEGKVVRHRINGGSKSGPTVP
ncbi:phosphate signaling complex protein PhoU [bacterium]|nr:phosphate signaling complex protein PhoU [bacterium]